MQKNLCFGSNRLVTTVSCLFFDNDKKAYITKVQNFINSIRNKILNINQLFRHKPNIANQSLKLL